MINLLPTIYVIIMLLFNPKPKKESLQLFKNTQINLIQLAAPPVQVYHAINKYAPLNDIPYRIAFGVAREETGYSGPNNYEYTYRQTSYTGAEGAMQFMPSTLRWFTGNQDLTRKQIRRDVELNISESMRYLKHIYGMYKNWHVSLGYYNSGYPKINNYALNIMNI